MGQPRNKRDRVMKKNFKLLSREEYETWLKSMPKDYCAFCDWPKNQIVLREGRNWVWIANIAPYWRYHTMLITKRHIKEMTEMSLSEMGELAEMYNHIINKFRKCQLKRTDGSEVKKYVFFWRLRDDLYDPVSGNLRPDHFHIHLAPDKDHLWDPVIEKDAHQIDIELLK